MTERPRQLGAFDRARPEDDSVIIQKNSRGRQGPSGEEGVRFDAARVQAARRTAFSAAVRSSAGVNGLGT